MSAVAGPGFEPAALRYEPGFAITARARQTADVCEKTRQANVGETELVAAMALAGGF
jgi:hypothetical protein